VVAQAALQVDIARVERGDELFQVSREGVVVVARGGLAGLAEAPAVVGDDTWGGAGELLDDWSSSGRRGGVPTCPWRSAATLRNTIDA
jgi:hypothetical protein